MNENLLCSGLFGKTRQAVLALLYGRADSSFYTKQILDAVKIGRGTVQRELKNLTDTGIIIREVQGGRSITGPMPSALSSMSLKAS